MSGDSNKEGQYPPPQWESQPPRGAYPLPQQALNYRGPPHAQPYQHPSQPSPSAAGEMVTLPPPQHEQLPEMVYGHHPNFGMYPQDVNRAPPQHMNYNQPAPRQRTAIACRYCRRRKIRCSGFEASDDGRCTNCQRFQQECIFTPVSSQAQAFVPAHTAYPHLRNSGPMLPQRGGRHANPQPAIYGAHGQRLGPMHPGQDPNYPPPYGYAMPSPTGPYPAPGYDDRGAPQPPPYPKEQVSRKRPRSDESSHPAVPPPPQEPSSHPYHQQGRASASGRRGSGSGYEYPDPTPLVPISPASSATSYQSAPYPPHPAQPYYSSQPQPPRRASPQSSYSYDARTSGSPHGSTSSASNYTHPPGLHPPQVLPAVGEREAGHTPPPREGNGGNGNNQRAAMSVRDLLGPENSQGGRTSADSDMLKALNKRGM